MSAKNPKILKKNKKKNKKKKNSSKTPQKLLKFFWGVFEEFRRKWQTYRI
jgi:hypothetical protein